MFISIDSLNRRGAIGRRRRYDAHGLPSARPWSSNERRKGRKGRKPRILGKYGSCRRCRAAAETGGNWRKLFSGPSSGTQVFPGPGIGPPRRAVGDGKSTSGNCGNPLEAGFRVGPPKPPKPPKLGLKGTGSRCPRLDLPGAGSPGSGNCGKSRSRASVAEFSPARPPCAACRSRPGCSPARTAPRRCARRAPGPRPGVTGSGAKDSRIGAESVRGMSGRLLSTTAPLATA